jgi:hypothetical protein
MKEQHEQELYILHAVSFSNVYTNNVQLVEVRLEIKGMEWAQQPSPPPESVGRPTKMLREVH